LALSGGTLITLLFSQSVDFMPGKLFQKKALISYIEVSLRLRPH